MDLRVGPLPKIRVLPRPEESLRTLVERAPEAEAFAERMLEKCRPSLAWFYSVRRRGATAAVTVLAVWLFVHVTFGANGMVVYRQKRAEYKSLQAEIGGLQKENDGYSKQINALKTDPKTIEREAREKLHYTRPGEVVYVAPTPLTPQPPESKAAEK
ncbi:MAG: septum formation initiator family protein [Terriglobales bacterium]|jgi:cell division protein FtsB